MGSCPKIIPSRLCAGFCSISLIQLCSLSAALEYYLHKLLFHSHRLDSMHMCKTRFSLLNHCLSTDYVNSDEGRCSPQT